MYVEIDDKKLEGKRFALTVYPKRLVVLQASFPYKGQLEEIQKRRRPDSLKDISTRRTPRRSPPRRSFNVESSDATASLPTGKSSTTGKLIARSIRAGSA